MKPPMRLLLRQKKLPKEVVDKCLWRKITAIGDIESIEFALEHTYMKGEEHVSEMSVCWQRYQKIKGCADTQAWHVYKASVTPKCT